MKKVNYGIAFFALSLGLFLACKKEPNVAPTPDTELQTSIDASYATFLASDVEMVASVMGEDASGSKAQFYEPAANSTGTTTVIRNVQTNRFSYTFNNTLCKDGHLRDGSVWMYFKETAYAVNPITGNENYTRDYNFTGRITLEEYKVDGWLIDNKDYMNSDPATNNTTILLRNLRPDNKTPIAGNLKWSYSAGLTMKKNLDSMAWYGTLIKTLENTSDTKVFAASAQSPITWSLAVISYVGDAKGYTPGNVPYTIKYYEKYPLKRDFTCSPDKLASVTLTTTGIDPHNSEFHPLVGGIASFTTGSAYPREIYYDNTGNTYGGDENPVLLPSQCDNKATVQIKGIYYPIDMKK
ncbi:MAG TPA: hypothetical protein PLQ93_03150 [Bacteroidia bacterium]|nr:hypothetical protein [Bacteroidia bacterium]